MAPSHSTPDPLPHRPMRSTLLVLAATLTLAACIHVPVDERAPQTAFMGHLAELEGRAFEGRILVDDPPQEDSPFAGEKLVMHVRRVQPGRIEIPFHVGEDRSRTWVLTETEDGLRLKHDHRKPDGSEDELTQYGGDTSAPGSSHRQDFPVDRFSVELFERLDRSVSTTNVWAMEIQPEHTFIYELRRPGRLFRVEFDLTRPVDVPPTPWGHG
jgi:hypothetical protein